MRATILIGMTYHILLVFLVCSDFRIKYLFVDSTIVDTCTLSCPNDIWHRVSCQNGIQLARCIAYLIFLVWCVYDIRHLFIYFTILETCTLSYLNEKCYSNDFLICKPKILRNAVELHKCIDTM